MHCWAKGVLPSPHVVERRPPKLDTPSKKHVLFGQLDGLTFDPVEPTPKGPD